MASLRELDVRHLQALDTVAREGTFGRAATSLGYTQSAISQQIATLERLVDGRVFDRPGGPRPVELTPLGARLLEGAREVLGRIDALDADLERFRTGEVGRLTIGTFQSTSTALLPLLVAELRSHFPEIEISGFETDDDDALAERLRRGELDLSFTAGDWGSDFEQIPLLDDPFVVVARPGQFAPGPVPVSVLAGEPLIGQPPQTACQLANETALRERGLDPNYVFRSGDNTTVTAMVRSGLGVAVLPLLCVEADDPRLALHPVEPSMPDRPIGLAWRAGRTLAPVAERFVELAGRAGAELAARPVPLLS